VRLLTNAVLQPIVSPLLSISWRLITPYIRPFCFKNDRTVVTLTRTTFDASCAAMVPQFLYAHSGLLFRQLPKLYARKLQKLVRRHARAARTAVVRLGDECVRLSFERSGTVLWIDPPATVWTSVANCCYLSRWLLPNRVHGLVKDEWQGATRLRFTLPDQSAPPCAQCVARMCVRCTRLPIPVATRLHS